MTYANTTHTPGFDWTQVIAQAHLEGGQAFLKTIGSVPKDITDAQLETDEEHATQRMTSAIDYARRDRANSGHHILSAVRNWSRKQAISLLRAKGTGEPIRPDFYDTFRYDLQQEISSLIADIQLGWDQADAQRKAAEQQQIAAQKAENEQAFGVAYRYIIGLNDAVLSGERQRQTVFESGHQAAQQWADKYGESVREREKQFTEREKHLLAREHEYQDHERAMHTLMRGGENVSFVDGVVRTGGRTLGCLFWLIIGFLVVFFGLFLALYLAFPHH